MERELGRGAFARVFRAWDEIIGRDVVLKVIERRGAAEGEEARTFHEARLVGNLQSPNIVTLYRLHILGEDGWILEMEHVDGGTLEDLLAQRHRLPALEVLAIVRGVLRGLSVAHGHGVLHRDVKPSNVLLGSDGVVKLTDFGLAGRLGDAPLHANGRAAPTGTPLYMAPEIIMGEPPSVASDLWSTGVLAYRMLCGRTPFGGEDLPSLFLALQNADPVPFDRDVPAELAALVTHCLARRPEDRPDGCLRVLETLDQVEPILRRRERELASTSGAGAPLAGRETEEHRIDVILGLVTAGRGTTVVVTGAAGLGKTTLLNRIAGRAHARGFRWVEATLSPVGGLVGAVVAALREALGARDRRETGASPGVSDSTVSRLLDQVAGTVSEERGIRERLVWSVERLLKTLAARQPVGLLIEEARYCSEDCLQVLADLTARLGKSRVLLAVAYRTDAVAPGGEEVPPPLRDLLAHRGTVHVPLHPLEAEAVYRVLEDEVGPLTLDPEVANLVLEKAQGNPLYALELLRHLEEVGGVVRDRTHVRPGPAWGRTPLPRQFHDVVARRLDGVPDAERTLLDAAAVDGMVFDGKAVADVVDLPLLGVLRAFQRIYRERGLVVPRPSGFAFVHPLVQEVIYEGIAPDLRREIHKRLARHLESRAEAEVDPERLGHHWESADMPERAAPALRRAAGEACRQQEPQRAVMLARRAGVLDATSDPDEDCRDAELLLGIASCELELGHHEPAQSIVDRVLEAARATRDEALRLRAVVQREEIRYATGGGAATSVVELERAGGHLPDSAARGRAYLLRGLVERDAGDLAGARAWLQEGERLFARLDMKLLRATTLNVLASVARRQGLPREAESLFGEAARIAEGQGHRTSAAVSEVNRAIASLSRGALTGLAVGLQDTIRSLAMTGAAEHAARAGAVLAQVHYAEGDLAAAERVIERIRRTLAKSDHLPGQVHVLPVRAHHAAVRGELDRALALAEGAGRAARKSGQHLNELSAVALEVKIACLAGDVDRAVDACRRGRDLLASRVERRPRARFVLRIAECVPFGLPQEGLDAVADLLPEPERRATCLPDLAGDALAGARALLKTGGAAAIRRMAEVYARPDVGERQAEYTALAGFLRATAAHRDGDDGTARREYEDALERAEGLRYVWLRLLCLEALAELDPGGTHRQTLAEATAGVAEGLGSSRTQRRLRDRWVPGTRPIL